MKNLKTKRKKRNLNSKKNSFWSFLEFDSILPDMNFAKKRKKVNFKEKKKSQINYKMI